MLKYAVICISNNRIWQLGHCLVDRQKKENMKIKFILTFICLEKQLPTIIVTQKLDSEHFNMLGIIIGLLN